MLFHARLSSNTERNKKQNSQQTSVRWVVTVLIL